MSPGSSLVPAATVVQGLLQWLQNLQALSGNALAALLLAEGEAAIRAGSPLPRGVLRGPIKQCFQNAGELLTADPSLTYCEGYAVLPDIGLPMLHAWCLTAEGRVVDPTWRDAEQAFYLGLPYQPEFCLAHWSTDAVWDIWAEFPSSLLVAKHWPMDQVLARGWLQHPEAVALAWPF